MSPSVLVFEWVIHHCQSGRKEDHASLPSLPKCKLSRVKLLVNKNGQHGITQIGHSLTSDHIGKYMVRTAPTSKGDFGFIPSFLNSKGQLLSEESTYSSLEATKVKVIEIAQDYILVKRDNSNVTICLVKEYVDENWIEADRFYSQMSKHFPIRAKL